MANFLVLYQSDYGKTKKIAELIVEGIREAGEGDIRLREISEATQDDLLWCDGIAMGSPTHYGNMSWKLKQWWDEQALPLWSKIDGKVGCVFTSSGGGASSGGEMCCLSMLSLLINFGFLVFGVTDYVAPKETLHYGTVIPGEPRKQSEIDACTLLGARLHQFVSNRKCQQ